MSDAYNESAETAPLDPQPPIAEQPAAEQTAPFPSAPAPETAAGQPLPAVQTVSHKTQRWVVAGVSVAVGLVVLAGTFASGVAVGTRVGGPRGFRDAGFASAQGAPGGRFQQGGPGMMGGRQGQPPQGQGYDGENDGDGDGYGRGHGRPGMQAPDGQLPQGQAAPQSPQATPQVQ